MIHQREFELHQECERVVTGTLKWYSPNKGFGFIVDDETGSDIRLTAKELREYGWDTIADGSEVEASVIETPRGLQVSELFEVVAPSTLDTSRVFGFDGLDYLAEQFVPASVVWYDANKGYGFVSTYGDEEHCFIHWSVLAEIGMMSVECGAALAVRIGRGTRGRVAASVRPSDRKTANAPKVVEAPHLIAA